MIKTLFFDLGNVLVNFSHDTMWEQFSHAIQAPVTDLKKIALEENIWPRLEKGLLSASEMLEIYEKSLKISPSYELAIQALTHIFTPMDSTEHMLKELHHQGIELILISNTCDFHFEYLKKHYPFISLFHALVLSYKIKLAKPDPKIYSYALSLTNSKKNECFYIDDIESFIDSAKAFGIAGHVYKSEALLKSTLLSLGLIF